MIDGLLDERGSFGDVLSAVVGPVVTVRVERGTLYLAQPVLE